MSGLGHSRRFDRAPTTSGLPRQPDMPGARRHVSKVQIVLQKSFYLTDHKFSGP
jgi:hypothetical protein